MNHAVATNDLSEAVLRAAESREPWAQTPLAERLAMLSRMRHALAADAGRVARQLTEALPQRRSVAETLAAEILPLLEGWRFLERRAKRILQPRRVGARGRPLWLYGSKATIHREPKGTVLVLCPFNYPLLLGGAPLGQALAAGNTVLLKPGRLGAEAAVTLEGLARQAGAPPGVVQVLDNSIDAGLGAIDLGVDHVVMTGSAEAGRSVMRRCAERLTPLTMELSGCDAVFVQREADIDHAVRCLAFGISINSGATCIAPRRVWVHRSQYEPFCRAMATAAHAIEPLPADEAATQRLMQLTRDALQSGARQLAGSITSDGRVRPIVLADISPTDTLLHRDVFAPALSLVPVDSDEQALRLDRRCPYALGASVFGKPAEAAKLAQQVDAGTVTVNDLIVPTADPRLPFGGRRQSGFGVTRGAEGLLELTRVRTVVHRPARFQPHLQPTRESDADRLEALIQANHQSTWAQRVQAWRKLIRPGS
ncbi:MAG: aldehyde dehydrogenase family protein [Phycisphaeraceae bacterium]